MTTEQLGEHPSPRPRADLSSSFSPPNRASGLSGRLARTSRSVPAPPSPPADPAADAQAPPLSAPPATEKTAGEKAPPQPAPTSPDTDPETALPALPHQPARRASRTRAPTPLRGDTEGGTITTIVYLPAEVLQQLRQARLRSGQTYTELVLDALDATHTRLADLLAAADRPQTRPAGSLFVGARRAAPATAQPKAQITLRPRASDAETIDALARDHGTNRSKLVTIALTAHLAAT
jgi:hypothetical protein